MLSTVRTTVTLDPDTREILRQRMERHGVSFKRALNDAVRESVSVPEDSKPFRTPTFSLGEPLVDLTHANRLADELEDEEVIRRIGESR